MHQLTRLGVSLVTLSLSLPLTGCGGDSDSGAAAPATGAGGSGGDAGGTQDAASAGPLAFTGAFTSLATIPSHHKCEKTIGGAGTGDNVSPPLEWAGVPEGTKSLAVTLIDASLSFLHWAIYDVPPTAPGLPEGIAPGYEVADPAGAHQTGPGAGSYGYFGPCSDGPGGSTYAYRLHALDVDVLPVDDATAPPAIRAAIEAATIEMVEYQAKPE